MALSRGLLCPFCVFILATISAAGVAQADSFFAANSDSYANTVLSQGPYAYWRLNETSGTTATDISGNGFDASYVVTPTLGASGPQSPDFVGFTTTNAAPSFNGTSDQRATANLTGLPSNYSVSMWVRNDRAINAQAVTAYMFSRSASATANGDNFGINGTAGSLGDQGDIILYNGSATVSSTTSLANGDDTWHHLAFTRSGTTVMAYLDGSQVLSDTLPVTFGAGTMVTFGTRADNFSDLLGQIDELAVFGSVLSPEQIAAQFNAAFTGPPPVTPEPGTLSLCGLALCLAGGYAWKRR